MVRGRILDEPESEREIIDEKRNEGLEAEVAIMTVGTYNVFIAFDFTVRWLCGNAYTVKYQTRVCTESVPDFQPCHPPTSSLRQLT